MTGVSSSNLSLTGAGSADIPIDEHTQLLINGHTVNTDTDIILSHSKIHQVQLILKNSNNEVIPTLSKVESIEAKINVGTGTLNINPYGKKIIINDYSSDGDITFNFIPMQFDENLITIIIKLINGTKFSYNLSLHIEQTDGLDGSLVILKQPSLGTNGNFLDYPVIEVTDSEGNRKYDDNDTIVTAYLITDAIGEFDQRNSILSIKAKNGIVKYQSMKLNGSQNSNLRLAFFASTPLNPVFSNYLKHSDTIIDTLHQDINNYINDISNKRINLIVNENSDQVSKFLLSHQGRKYLSCQNNDNKSKSFNVNASEKHTKIELDVKSFAENCNGNAVQSLFTLNYDKYISGEKSLKLRYGKVLGRYINENDLDGYYVSGDFIDDLREKSGEKHVSFSAGYFKSYTKKDIGHIHIIGVSLNQTHFQNKYSWENYNDFNLNGANNFSVAFYQLGHTQKLKFQELTLSTYIGNVFAISSRPKIKIWSLNSTPVVLEKLNYPSHYSFNESKIEIELKHMDGNVSNSVQIDIANSITAGMHSKMDYSYVLKHQIDLETNSLAMSLLQNKHDEPKLRFSYGSDKFSIDVSSKLHSKTDVGADFEFLLTTRW